MYLFSKNFPFPSRNGGEIHSGGREDTLVLTSKEKKEQWNTHDFI